MDELYTRNRHMNLNDYIKDCIPDEDDEDDEDFDDPEEKFEENVFASLDDYLIACLNDLQQNKSFEEYTKLMCVLHEKELHEKEKISDDNQSLKISDVTDDAQILLKYINEYTDYKQYNIDDTNHDAEKELLLEEFIIGHYSNVNFIEEDINDFYNSYFNEPVDINNVSDEFKKSIKKTKDKTNRVFNKNTIQQYLDDENFDKSLTDQDGDTLMTAVCQFSDDEMIFEIIQRSDIDLNQPDDFGNTPFIKACQNKPNVAIEILNHDQIDLNAQDNQGVTGFHHAVRQNPELASALMDCDDIDINKPDNEGITPFMSASICSNHCVYEMLKRDDVDFNAQDNQGRTASNKIVENEHFNTYTGSGVKEPSKERMELIGEMERSGKIDFSIKNNDGYDTNFYFNNEKLKNAYKPIRDQIDNDKLKENFNQPKQPAQNNKRKNKML